MKKIVITGFGFILSSVKDKEALWNVLVDKDIQMETKFSERLGIELKIGKEPVYNLCSYSIQPKKLKYLDKQVIYTLIAVVEAIKDAKIDENIKQEIIADHIGIVLGTMTAQTEFGLKQVEKMIKNNSYNISIYTGLAFYFGASVAEAAMLLRTKGESYSVLTGSTSSLDSVIFSRQLIQRHINDIMIAGCGENILYDFFYNVLTKDKRITQTNFLPYTKNRDGCFLSNGAGVIIIESEENALSRGKYIYSSIEATYTLTASSCIFQPNQELCIYTEKVIKKCLDIAKLKPDEIDLIIPTASASLKGDMFELKGIYNIFKEASKIIYSPKPIIGDTLSFSGIMDIITANTAIEKKCIPGFPEVLETGNNQYNRLFVKDCSIHRDIRTVLLINYGFENGRVVGIILKRYENR